MKLYELKSVEHEKSTSKVYNFIRGKLYPYIESYLWNYMVGKGFFESFYYTYKYPVDY